MRHQIEHSEVIGGIQYCMVNEEYKQQVVDFMFDVFLKDEPSTKSFGGYKTRPPAMVKQIEDVIDDGISVMALDPACSNKLIGLRLAYSITRDQVEPRGSFKEYRKVFPDTHAAIMTLFDELLYPGDIFQSHSDVTKIYDMFALATHPDYRGKGIAGKLVQQALKVARKADCDAVAVIATSDYSAKIFKKMGMQALATKEWQDLVYDGVRPFNQVQSENATAYLLKLRKND